MEVDGRSFLVFFYVEMPHVFSLRLVHEMACNCNNRKMNHEGKKKKNQLWMRDTEECEIVAIM